MRKVRELVLRFGGLFNKKRKDRELDEEIESHLQLHIEDNLRLGMTPEEARRQAMIKFGGVESMKESYRDQRSLPVLETLWQDIRYGARQLRKNPGFTAVAVLTLALGIGANTAIFSVVDQLLVRPLPVARPEQLALLGQPGRSGMGFEFNYPLFRDYQKQNTVFSELAAIGDQAVGIGTTGATERQKALLVSGNYFRMLGVDAALGRTFAPNEGVEIDDAPVIVLSHGLWHRSFGADPTVIGRAVTVNAKPFTIIGVAPREFQGTTRGAAPDLYLPITMLGQLTDERPGGDHPLRTRFLIRWIQICGRLKDGVNREQAREAMSRLAQQVRTVTPANTSTNLAALPGAQGFTGDLQDARLPLKLLLGTAALVLLIACANLANLQLVRAASRSREFAVRLAWKPRASPPIRLSTAAFG